MNESQQKAYDQAQVMLAYANGAQIEFREKGVRNWINRCAEEASFLWDWFTYEYRIAPKPLECWAWRFPDGTRGATGDSAKILDATYRMNQGRAVLMREVV